MDHSLIDQQQLYDHGWRKALDIGKEQRGNLQTNLEFLARVGLLKPKDRILEIGCGIGSVVQHLHQQGYSVTGTDISREAIQYGKEKYPQIELEVQPAEQLPYAGQSFDVVLSFDLFEHIARIDQHVDQVRRVLKAEGLYLLQTPNKLSNCIFETLAHRTLKWRRYHPSLHSAGQLRRRLARHGFSAEFVKMNPMNAFAKAKLDRFGLCGRLVARLPFTSLPLWMQTNLYVVARKDEVKRN